MIEQHYIEATPKYNFPLALQPLPKKLVKLSLNSTNNSKPSCLTQFIHADEVAANPVKLDPAKGEVTIAAIDVSSIKIGLTSKGEIIAVQGAVVWRQNKYNYVKLGPFPFHITSEIEDEFSHLLRSFNRSNGNSPSLGDSSHLQIGNLLERWIQMFVCKNCQNAVLLFDGSLAAKNSDASTLALILAAASKRGNIVLAISKETQLKFLGRRLTVIMEPHQAPCALPLPGDSQTVSPVKQLGRIYGVKLSQGHNAFRLDIDKHVPREEAFHALRKLLGNDLLMQGYPETLRLAHIFSTFTAVEVIGIQHYLASNCDLKITIRPNIRRLLFGPFGKGGRDSFH